MSGPVFRLPDAGPTRQTASSPRSASSCSATGGPAADAEIIWLADWSARGTRDRRRIDPDGPRRADPRAAQPLRPSPRGHLGPDRIAERGRRRGSRRRAVESALERLAGWLQAGDAAREQPPSRPGRSTDPGVDRLFRHARARRHGPPVGPRDHRATEAQVGPWPFATRGPGPGPRPGSRAGRTAGAGRGLLDRLDRDYAALAPESVAALRGLLAMLAHHGVDPNRIELDLGFGRGIGFYTQMIFEITVPTPDGPVEVCGGGRYDGLARVLGSEPRRPGRRLRLRPRTVA